MTLDLWGEARGLLAFAALLLLPGLLVVRAPWASVPFLSLSFWAVSWGWCDALGIPRSAFLKASLTAFAALVLLRLLKPWSGTWPAWPAWTVVLAGLVFLWPHARWPVPPGQDLDVYALSALLLTWRDGLPNSYSPLLALSGFGAHAVALPGLAADVALLSGLAPHRATSLLAAAVPGLLGLAHHLLFTRFWPAAPSAVGVFVALLVSVGLGARGPAELAMVLAVATAALLAGWESRSSAFAAGLLAGGALAAEGVSAVLALLLLTAVVVTTGKSDPRRLALAGGFALLSAAPLLWRVSRLSGGPGSFAEAWVGLLTPPALGMVGLGLGATAAARLGRLASPRLAGLAALLLTTTAVVQHLRLGREAVPSSADLEAMQWIEVHARPADVFCIATPGGRWIPALTRRGIRPASMPATLAWAVTPSRQPPPCTHAYGTPDRSDPGRVVFRNVAVAITSLTTFDSKTGNRGLAIP